MKLREVKPQNASVMKKLSSDLDVVSEISNRGPTSDSRRYVVEGLWNECEDETKARLHNHGLFAGISAKGVNCQDIECYRGTAGSPSKQYPT